MHSFPESLALDGGQYVEASPTRFRLIAGTPWQDAPPDRFPEPGDPATTRQLMAGAYYAGLRGADATHGHGAESELPSLLSHIHGLAAAFQTTHATPRAMRRVAERLAARGDSAGARYCLGVVREEDGHDRLALNDLRALGLPADDFVARVRPPAALALVELLEASAESEQPIALLGYAYALERSSLFRTAEYVAAVERCIPAGIRATRCLRVHSALGTEAGHLAQAQSFIASRPPVERAAIAHAAFRTAQRLVSDYPGDDAMRAILRAYDWVPPADAVQGDVVQATPDELMQNRPRAIHQGEHA